MGLKLDAVYILNCEVSSLMGLGKCADEGGTIHIQRTSSAPVGGMKFSLKRMREDSHTTLVSQTSLKSSQRRLSRRHGDDGSDDERNLFRALKTKPWLRYHKSKDSSEDELDIEEMNTACKASSLPIGIVRGCSSCAGCQKVLARWRPEAGCRPGLEEAPVFFPLEEEFQDTVKYIASISAEAEPYGICRIVPPHSWRPPCPLKDSEKRRTTMFPTRVQRLDKLQVREAQVKKEGKKRRGHRFAQSWNNARRDVSDEDGKFGFEPGPSFTLETFEKYAHQFKAEYFGLRERNEGCNASLPNDEPSVECIEGEYWRIVEHATEQLEVLYGADIETGKFGSGFPKVISETNPSPYETSGWNLNNIARLGGSVLSFEEEDISGVLVPWLYVGMCLSSFCWHVEDHHFYSLNYMHFGSPKVWYGVPGSAAHKLESAMKKHLPELFEEQPDLLHKLVTQLSPSILKADGVPVYRAVQKPGEFVVTFPRAYHAGFNCGFNCAEAVNVAPIDWLPAGQNAVELYKQQKRKSTISHDKLLLGAAREYLTVTHKLPGLPANNDSAAWQESFEQNKVLLQILKDRVDLERSRRSHVENFVLTRRMDKGFDLIDAKECSICHYDLHLSAVGCECGHERYTCLEHVQDLCACEKSKKHALYRYELSELDALVAALEGSCNGGNEVEDLVKLFTGLRTSHTSCNEPKEQEALTIEQTGVSPFGAGSSSVSFGESTMSGLKASLLSCNEPKKHEALTIEQVGEQVGVGLAGAVSGSGSFGESTMSVLKASLTNCNEPKKHEALTLEQAGMSLAGSSSASFCDSSILGLKASQANCDETNKHEALTIEKAGVSPLGAGSSSESFGDSTMSASNSRVHITPQKVDTQADASTMSASNSGAHISMPKVETQADACAPAESIWNGGFDEMSAFLLKDFENFEQLIANSKDLEATSAEGKPDLSAVATCPSNSQVKSEPLPCEYTPKDTRCLEVIVLSDDEDCPGNQCLSNHLHAINSTVAKTPDTKRDWNLSNGLPLPSQQPNTIASWTSSGLQTNLNLSNQSDRPLVVKPEENEILTLTLQHTKPVQISPSFFTGLQDSGAEGATPSKDWLCLGHLETSSINQESCEYLGTGLPFGQSRCERQNLGGYTAPSAAVDSSLHTFPLLQSQEVGARVELLCTGRLVLGMSWCNKDAIFPAGFRSRVLFPSILDPCMISFYVSEILDYGHTGPVFKVSMEEHPNEVFLHGSIDRCWQMVQERINIMIQLHYSLGKVGLPRIRPPEDIRGLELFGFTSPHIVKAVETLDRRRQCLQYWTGRVSAIGLLQNQYQPQFASVNEPGFMFSHRQSRTLLGNAGPMGFNSMPMHNVWR